jgi:hypothetical protein
MFVCAEQEYPRRMAAYPRKPELTPAERHARFKELAREVDAEGEAPGFDETVKRLAQRPKEPDSKK